MRPAIRANDISKRYAIERPGPHYRTFREAIMEGLRAPARMLSGRNRDQRGRAFFWALKDVTFEIAPGEVVGIVGRNGAGKSTLLRILSRITRPTSGTAELRGRTGSLLDIGTGFHSELSGVENVYLNGAILGMRRNEVRRKLDRIVEFAGVEAFSDTAIKHYSMGMRLRLAFAVAAHLDTEILLADEILAVGDAAFQKKCIEEMSSLAKGGRTVLFVSHNMGTIAQLCPRTILLDKGQVRAFGRTVDVIGQYLSEFTAQAPQAVIQAPSVDRGAAISAVQVMDSAGRLAGELDWRLPFHIGVEFRVTKRLPAMSLGITLVNHLGIAVLFSWIVNQQAFQPGVYRAEGELPGETLQPGRYHVDVGCHHKEVEEYHRARQVVLFEIMSTTEEFDDEFADYGTMYCRVPWRVETVTTGRAQPTP